MPGTPIVVPDRIDAGVGAALGRDMRFLTSRAPAITATTSMTMFVTTSSRFAIWISLWPEVTTGGGRCQILPAASPYARDDDLHLLIETG